MYVHAPYMCLVSAESWKGITLPGTGVITVVGHHVCAGNGTQNPVFSASELLSRPDLFLFVRQSPPRCIPNLCHQTCAMRPVHLHYFVFKILFSGDRILPCSSDCPQICDNLPDSCSQCWNTFLSYHTQLHWPLCCLFVSLYVCVCVQSWGQRSTLAAISQHRWPSYLLSLIGLGLALGWLFCEPCIHRMVHTHTTQLNKCMYYKMINKRAYVNNLIKLQSEWNYRLLSHLGSQCWRSSQSECCSELTLAAPVPPYNLNSSGWSEKPQICQGGLSQSLSSGGTNLLSSCENYILSSQNGHETKAW